jgi:transposase-like protein
MLKAEQLIGAGRYERSAERQDTRAGHYERGFGTKAGRVKLKMPKLKKAVI